MEIGIRETSSIISKKVMGHTITTPFNRSIRDSSRTIKEKGMEFTDTRVVTYMKQNIKEEYNKVTYNNIMRIICTHLSHIIGRIMVCR